MTEKQLISKTIRDGECLLWTGKISTKGLALTPRVWFRGQWLSARRTVFEIFFGEILEDGQVIEMTCGKSLCVNYRHMRLVAKEKKRTHCRHGHLLTDDNIIVEKSGRKRCRACRHRFQRNWYLGRGKG